MSIERNIEGFHVQFNLADIPNNQVWANDLVVQDKIAEKAFEQNTSGFLTVTINDVTKNISWELLNEENSILKQHLNN